MQIQDRRREVLGFFYEHQHTGSFHNPYGGLPVEEWAEVASICRYLRDKGFINWMGSGRPDVSESGKITARGIDRYEQTDQQMPSVSIHNSHGIQIGNGNTLTMGDVAQRVTAAIEASGTSPEEKAEAQSLWARITNNQTFAAIVGAIAGAIIAPHKVS